MSHYYSAGSNYPSPTRKPQKHQSNYSLHPSSSLLHVNQNGTHLSQKTIPRVPSFRSSRPGPTSRLGTLISKFEALDVISQPLETSSLQPSPKKQLSIPPRCATGEPTTDSPPRKMSTMVFSPRPPSTGRYENVFLEDESPVEKDDVFTCPPYNTVGSVKRSELERLKRSPTPPKNNSIEVQESSQDSNQLPWVEAIPSKREENINSFRRNSIKDRIRFYDGGSDLPTPFLKPAPNVAKNVAKIRPSFPRQTAIVTAKPVTLVSARLSQMPSIISSSIARATLSPKLSSQSSPTKPDLPSISRKQNSGSTNSSPVLVHTPGSVSRSLIFKTPGSTNSTKITGPGSAQKSESSPLRERRLTRSNIPKKSSSSLTQSTEKGSSFLPRLTDRAGSQLRGRSHVPRPSMEKKERPPEWKQMDEKIIELYRAKSKERTSMQSNLINFDLDPVASPSMSRKYAIQSPEEYRQVDGPAASRKTSKIPGLRALFDEGYTKQCIVPQSKSPEPIVVKRINVEKDMKDHPKRLVMKRSMVPTDVDLSVILEKREQSLSTSMMEDTRPLSHDDEVNKPTPMENCTFSPPIQDVFPQRSPPPRSDGCKSPQEEDGSLGPLMPDLPTHASSPHRIEQQETEEIESQMSPLPPVVTEQRWSPSRTVPVISINEAEDPDRTLTPPLPEDAKLWVPKKRKAATHVVEAPRVKTPYVATILSPVQDVKLLRMSGKRLSFIPQVAKSATTKLPVPSVPQKPQTKNKGIEDRIKLFEQKVSEVRVRSNISLKGAHLKSKADAVPGPGLKSKSKGMDKIAAALSIRRVLSMNTIDAIVTGFQEMEEAATGKKKGEGRGGRNAAKMGTKDALKNMEPVERKDAGLDGANESILRDMVVREVECEMISPKPVRLAEMNRMTMLCRGKVDKSMRYKKH